MEEEIWKDVVGYEGKYSVSDKGRVKNIKKGNILSPGKNMRGYHQVNLFKKGRKIKSVHRLVATAFIPNPENKEQVNHKNFNTIDNSVENLEWVTASENQKHSYLHKPKRRSYFIGKIGGQHPSSKKICIVDKKGNVLKIFDGIREAARTMNVTYGSIRYSILRPYKWKLINDRPRKYHWKYID